MFRDRDFVRTRQLCGYGLLFTDRDDVRSRRLHGLLDERRRLVVRQDGFRGLAFRVVIESERGNP